MPRDLARARAQLSGLVDASKTPGIQYVAIHATDVICTYAAGVSDVRSQTPMAPETTMMAYSMSKTITAAAALQLVDRGQLSLDTPVAEYLPESPYGSRVTVGQLVTHTGGIPNPIPLRWVHPAAAHDRFAEDAALAAVMRAHPRLSHEPGTKYAYSNIGYWMLGKIVERAADLPFTSYVIRNILGPLGISPAKLGYTVIEPEHHASGYLEKYSLVNLLKGWLLDAELIGDYEGPWLRVNDHYPNGPAFGGLVGTAEGFGRFLQDQLQPHSVLFSDTTRALFYAAQHTGAGTAVPMTFGWHVGTIGGTQVFFKEGGGGGFHSMMRIYPTRGIASVVMTNATRFDVAACLNGLDAAE